MTSKRFKQFESNISRARELVGLGDAVHALSSARLDPTDLYRSSLVQAVAAMDTYVHAVVLDLGTDIILGRRSPGSASKIGLHIGLVRDILDAPDPVEKESRVRGHLAQRLGTETFQKPDSIAQAFAMVGIAKIWAACFGPAAEATILRLNLIVRRRNAIVHECDADSANPGSYQEISATDAIAALLDVKKTVTGLDAILV